jgi:ATP-dependent Clp protease protease subunit
MNCKGDGCKPAEKHPLELALLEQEIKKATFEAKLAEIEYAGRFDTERDRLVKTGRIRHLYINDAITGSMVDKWLDALQHWERRDPGEPITIDINSPGGSITDGLALYDQLMRMRRKGHHVTTRGLGMVASMAAVLLQAGDVRQLDARAKLLIHEGSVQMVGSFTVGEQEDHRAFRDMLLSNILDILAERSTLSRRQIQNRWRRKDWWLTADEALKLGFVDVVE